MAKIPGSMNLEVLRCKGCRRLAFAADDTRISHHKCWGPWTVVFAEKVVIPQVAQLSAELAAAKSRIGELEQERDRAARDMQPLVAKALGADLLQEQVDIDAGWNAAGEAIVESLQAQLAAVQQERDSLLQERGAEGTNWFPESFVSQLHAQLAAMTEDRDLWKEAHDDDCPNKNMLDTTEAQLAAVTQERDTLKETLSSSEEYRRAYQAGKMALYSMGSPFTEAAMEHLPCGEGALDRRFTKLIEMPRIAQLQAHNKRLRDALEKAKHGLEAAGMGCGYIDAALTEEENPA